MHIGTSLDELLDQLHVCPVVLYIEQGAQPRTMLYTCPGQLKRLVSIIVKLQCLRGIQFDPEHTAHPDDAFHADLTPHQVDQALAHYQADAGALLGAALLSQTIEWLKQL